MKSRVSPNELAWSLLPKVLDSLRSLRVSTEQTNHEEMATEAVVATVAASLAMERIPPEAVPAALAAANRMMEALRTKALAEVKA